MTTGKRTVQYDKLIFATGSNPLVPPINGKDQDGVFCLRTIADADSIKEYIADKQNVLVIGGGVLGLELAWALHEMSKNVTVAHLMNSLMEKIFMFLFSSTSPAMNAIKAMTMEPNTA